MTITDTIAANPASSADGADLADFDLYRDIHKGIRGLLFTVTSQAGQIDPGDRLARLDLAERVDGLVDFLVAHAGHEDDYCQPTIAEHLPELAARIDVEHHSLEATMDMLRSIGFDVRDASPEVARRRTHQLYLELATFTSAYLLHQDLEERVVMPALEKAVGFEALLAIHGAIVGSHTPEEMGAALSLMLPAMNIDDRAELLGGMRAGAPAEVFQGVWGLTGTLISPADHRALATRLGIG
jgi:hypothetical protein